MVCDIVMELQVVVVAVLLSSSIVLMQRGGSGSGGVRAQAALGRTAQFVFGDSLVDAGNNNYLPLTLSAANTPPFGIDFPANNANNPTGRFTNGFTIPDMLVVKLGGKTLPLPFMAPTTKGEAILGGVNYASGGGGILNDTGRAFIQRIPLDQQIGHFEQTKQELISMLGEENAIEYLSTAVFSVTIGSNDFLNNYLFPVPTTRERFSQVGPYILKVINRFRLQLERIYDGGARKMVIVNVPPIGCTPYQRTIRFHVKGSCPSLPNDLAQEFNSQLRALLVELQEKLDGAHFVYGDVFAITLDIILNPEKYGFEETTKACCGRIGPDKGLIPCRRSFPVCPDRSKFFFWDPYHPTQAGYQIIADALYEDPRYTYPMTIEQLAQV